jgi:hypothetical protein
VGNSITQHSRDPVDQASNENIRNQGGDLAYDQGLAEVDPLQFDELIDDIDCKSGEENLSYRPPTLSQPMLAMLRFCYQLYGLYGDTIPITQIKTFKRLTIYRNSKYAIGIMSP